MSQDHVEQIVLRSGRRCALSRPPVPICRRYLVLFFPQTQGEPTQDEREEMLTLAYRKAREYSARWLGDPECFTIIHNGKGPRRARDTHFHILLLRSREEKTRAYLRLFLKNCLQWLGLRRTRFTPEDQRLAQAS